MTGAVYQPFPMLPGRRGQVWRHHPAYRRPRHFHLEPELNLVVRGEAELGVGSRAVRLGAGELIGFAPGQDHVLLRASPDLELFVCALTPELAERAARPPLLRGRLRLTDDELHARARELHALGEMADTTVVERRLAELFEELAGQASAAHVLSRRAVDSLRQRPELSGAALSEELAAPPTQISRHFHRDVGVKLVEYRSRLRLMRFIALVDRGQSLTQAALSADFGSYAQCHRVFRRALGFTPTEYFRGARHHVDGIRDSLD